MQGKKATIQAEFDPDTGEVSFNVSGDSLELCFLLGQLARDLAKSWVSVRGIPEELALGRVLAAITMATRYEPGEGSKLDLSHEYNGG